MEIQGTAREIKNRHGLSAQRLAHLKRKGLASYETRNGIFYWTVQIPEPETVGQMLRRMREERFYTQDTMFRLTDIDQRTIALYETDRVEPGTRRLDQILQALEATFSQFFARLEGVTVPENARATGKNARGVEDAVWAAIVDCGLSPDNYNSLPRVSTLRRVCEEQRVDWLGFWRLVDAYMAGGAND